MFVVSTKQEDEVVGSCSTNGRNKNACNLLAGKTERKRLVGRAERRWENNIKMDLKEIGYGAVVCIYQAQDRVHWRALENTVMNLRVSIKYDFFLLTELLLVLKNNAVSVYFLH
jgi:hypothetical protein